MVHLLGMNFFSNNCAVDCEKPYLNANKTSERFWFFLPMTFSAIRSQTINIQPVHRHMCLPQTVETKLKVHDCVECLCASPAQTTAENVLKYLNDLKNLAQSAIISAPMSDWAMISEQC